VVPPPPFFLFSCSLFFLAFAVLDLMASLECARERKGGGGTTALQGSHQTKKGKNRKKEEDEEKEEEGRWRNHRTPGKSSDQESTASRMNACGATARCVSLVPSNDPPHSLIHGHWS
jgi:hypothetical protein